MVGHPIEATADWPAQPWTALASAREGTVPHRLGFDDFAYGEWERGTWNFQPWHEGPDLYPIVGALSETGFVDPTAHQRRPGLR
jgi:hypothetical protein